MKIGVVSDTHGYFDPYLKEVLRGVDLILHAGDVGSPEVLDKLGRIAKVHAIRGNVDPPELGLPLSAKLYFEPAQIEMVHILPVPQSELEDWETLGLPEGKPPRRSEAFLKSFDESTGVVIFGHTHQPCLVALGERLFFNPGSAGKKRFDLPRCCGILKVLSDRLLASIVLLEKYNGTIPPRVRMDFEE